MSRALIQRMFDHHVFDSVLLAEDQRDFHVPFDTLTGRTETEAALRLAVTRYERTALTGVSGSGKSSVARYALDPAPAGIAPIFVPVAYKSREVATDAGRFATYLVEVLSRAAVAAHRIPRREREALLAGATPDINLPTIARKNGIGLAVKAWILQGNVARDVTRTVDGGAIPRSADEALERANDVLEAIKAHALDPVLIMDDTDRLIGRDNPDTMIPAFFAGVVRPIVDALHAGIVIAAQPFYLDREDYRRHTTGLIENHIKIPEIPDADGLGAILTLRVKYAEPRRTAQDAFTEEALDGLFDVYHTGEERSVRRALAAAHAALSRAQATRADEIDVEHVLAGADDALLT
jgi:hypothetical protein